MTSPTRWRAPLPTYFTLLFGVLAACSRPDSSVLGPNRLTGPSFWVGGDPEPGAVQVCNYGPTGTYSYTVAERGGTGTFPLGTSFTLTAGECEVVWRTTSTARDSVRVTLTATPAGVKTDSVVGFTTESVTPQVTFTGSTLQFRFIVNSQHSGSARFYSSSTNPLPPPSRITVCKNGPPGTYNFTADAQRGTLLVGNAFTLQAGECKDVWEATAPIADPDPKINVHVTEVTGLLIRLDSIVADTTTPGKGPVVVTLSRNTIEFEVNYFHGGFATFYNSPAPAPPQQRITVCKVGPVGSYNFTVSATGGSVGNLPLGGSFTLGAGECADVWTSNPPTTDPDPTVTVVVTEVALPPLIQFDSMAVDTTDGGVPGVVAGNSVTFGVNAFHGGKVTYYDSKVPPPPAKFVTVCKNGPSGMTFNFTVSVTGPNPGTLLQGASFTLQAGECKDVWTSADPTADPEPYNTVTINEVSLPPLAVFDSTSSNVTGDPATVSTNNTVQLLVNAFRGGQATYYNHRFPEPPPKRISVCKVGPTGTYNFTIAQNGGNGGTLLLGSSFTLQAGQCKDVWESAELSQINEPLTTVTVTEVSLPTGIRFDSSLAATTGDPAVKSTTTSNSLLVNAFKGGSMTFFNSLIPPPPRCGGLTPGYWKNWRNKYTTAQFTLLLQGTVATSIVDADNILKTNNPAVPRLKKFVLASQLTINLTNLIAAGNNLPNPSGGSLVSTCSAGGGQLGPTLTIALQILANPSAYTTAYIDSIKNILDAIANLGGG